MQASGPNFAALPCEPAGPYGPAYARPRPSRPTGQHGNNFFHIVFFFCGLYIFFYLFMSSFLLYLEFLMFNISVFDHYIQICSDFSVHFVVLFTFTVI